MEMKASTVPGLAKRQFLVFVDRCMRYAIAEALILVSLTAATGCSRSDVDTSHPLVSNRPVNLTDEASVPQKALARAAGWLWKAQSSDGGWHSETYRLLDSGQALTPFVLYTLLQVPEDVYSRPEGGVKRALAWIRNTISVEGEVGLTDPEIPEYPNYATAFALLCLVRAGSDEDKPRIDTMRDHLIDQQFRKQNGFGPQTVVFGGWGFGGPLPTGGSPGHMDVHHTRVVLQALRAVGVADSVVFRRAEAFLRVVQKHPDVKSARPDKLETATFVVWDAPYDGGFYFSPVVIAANKGGTSSDGQKTYFRSYASATCDGILALQACQLPPDDERIIRAREWLKLNPQLDWPGGVPQDAANNWGESIRFTHYAARAEVQAALESPAEDRRKLADLVAAKQHDDGSFKNGVGFLMKEDDPILCTSLAAIALSMAIE